ncbi:MAG: serine/threonine-protein kinase [Cyanobacteria bacterium J06643_4]
MQQQLVGHQLNEHYRITAVLGQQSGRRTFLAETADQSLVVIKLVLFGPDFEWADLKLFEREAETLRSLDHPAIPKYLDSFEVDTPLGKGFALVQTYIEAKSLAEWVTAGRRFQEADLQPMARALLSILYYLHSCYPAVIHRDIKPSNILLSEASADGPAKLYLVDFGSVQAAKKDGTMTIVGTYGYMPPEQFSGRSHPASDLYSLGATLIYLATSKHPTELTQDSFVIEFEHLTQFSPSFTQWLTQLIQPNLLARPSSAQQALSQLTAKQLTASLSRTIAKQPPTQSAVPTQKNYRGFSVHTVHNSLVVKCFQSQIREPIRQQKSAARLLVTAPYNRQFYPELLKEIHKHLFLKVFFVCWMFACFLSALEIFAGVLFLVLAYWLFYPRYWLPKPLQNSDCKVTLRLTKGEADILISLMKFPSDDSVPILYCSDIPLSQIRSQTKSVFKNTPEISFATFPDFSFDEFKNAKQLRIVATSPEIKWLSQCIMQWRNLP